VITLKCNQLLHSVGTSTIKLTCVETINSSLHDPAICAVDSDILLLPVRVCLPCSKCANMVACMLLRGEFKLLHLSTLRACLTAIHVHSSKICFSDLQKFTL